ncbi:ROK family protein [Escherichia marmotae]|nr:ROK family protein [Escherichia marmotae]
MYYGFDIGGTKIALGVFDNNRQLQWEKRVSTPRDGYDAFLDAVCELVTEADLRFGCKGSVGIGIPGMPETEDGTLYAVNVPAASGKPLRADLSARLDREVRLNNDANCFVLSEAWDEEFTQYPLVMGLILGTGVGGGLSNFPAITTQLTDRLPRHLLPVARVPRIERARHGDAGGMRGAAFLHLTD